MVREELIDLISKYFHEHGKNGREIGALLYSLGQEETYRILKEAAGREIIIEYDERHNSVIGVKYKNEDPIIKSDQNIKIEP